MLHVKHSIHDHFKSFIFVVSIVHKFVLCEPYPSKSEIIKLSSLSKTSVAHFEIWSSITKP